MLDVAISFWFCADVWRGLPHQCAHWFAMTFLGFCKQGSSDQKKLGRQNGRNAEGEFSVPGFMAECVHANQAADASAENGGGEKRRFGDPPEIFLGPELVRKHKCAANGIDYKEVE